MAATLTNLEATVTLKLNTTARKTVEGVELRAAKTVTDEITLSGFGAAAGEANVIFYDAELSIAANTRHDLDLNGTLKDYFQDTVAFAEIRAIFIKNKSDDAGTIVEVGGDASTNGVPLFVDLSDKFALGQNASMLLQDFSDGGLCAVTPATADILEITNKDLTNAAKVEVMVIGTES